MSRANKIILKDNMPFYQSLVEKHNPLGFTQEDGSAIFFAHPSDAYIVVLSTLMNIAPRGYVELPLVISKLYKHLSFSRCVLVAKELHTWVNMVTLLPKWGSGDSKRYYANLCSALCSITEVSYNSAYTEMAWQSMSYRFQVEEEVRKNESK